MAKRGQGEGSISQRKDGVWQAAVSVGDGKRQYFYGKTRREVAEKLKVALRDQQQGLLIVGPDVAFDRFLERWLQDSVKPSVRPKTYESYARQVRVHIAPALGGLKLTKLAAADLQRFYRAMLDAGLAPGTVNRQHAIIHRALAQATRWGLVARNVADLVDPPRPEHKEMQPLTPSQVGEFLRAARDDRFFALYVLAIATGMRQSELLGLTWRDVNEADALVYVRQQLIYTPGAGFSFSEPKTAKGRRAIALPGMVVEALRAHRVNQESEKILVGEAWEENGLVFPNEVGRPIERGNLVRRSFLPLLDRAGLPRIRFHDLRHTAATLLLSEGAHPKVVQERLGHSTIGVTLDVYSHVLPHMQREAAAKLDRLLGSGPGLL